ncbi:MAG: YhcH/YjgK/YiaL family protein [Humidesulfovibrio sp.]|uniref:YhcH/YjgK/YiaL family protein n=1 Tax=Humidesulfovibrio sp. TaxID=2910988 RepID=UPI0027EDEBA5|nr:YhcH/YjgK/YiaL family protein [Humidesulfovibrio sp.]MDQ7834666.1 YhcH/YjgK/YiaL family protein [Humidesulfovibrio sp.]
MILDALENWQLYSQRPAWQKAFAWVLALTPDTALGEHAIDLCGNGRADMYGVVFDFQTKNLLDTTLEAHRVYADLHVPLTGPEVHARFCLEELTAKTPYDEATDAAQYNHPDRFNALFTLHPGQFALYLPHDAHLSQCKTTPATQTVRKAVVKIRAELLLP